MASHSDNVLYEHVGKNPLKPDQITLKNQSGIKIFPTSDQHTFDNDLLTIEYQSISGKNKKQQQTNNNKKTAFNCDVLPHHLFFKCGILLTLIVLTI